jgi:hypothetical protein
MCRTSGAWKTETYTEYISRAMKHTIVQDGKTYEKQSGAWRLRPKTRDGDSLDQLPTDPAKLLSLMQSSPEYTGPNVFLQVGSLPGRSPAGPKLRAALYQAYSGKVDWMIIDPGTAMLLETSATAAKPGETAQRVTYLSVGLVDKIG